MAWLRKAEENLFSYQGLKEKIAEIPFDFDFLLIALSYANGARVEETRSLRYCDISWDNEFLYAHSRVLKKKEKEIIRRRCPIDRKMESWITERTIEIIQRNRQSETDIRPLFTISNRTAKNRFYKILNCNSHSMRHNRVTHLITVFGYGMRDLLEYFLISPRTLASWSCTYGHLEKSFLIEKARAFRVQHSIVQPNAAQA